MKAAFMMGGVMKHQCAVIVALALAIAIAVGIDLEVVIRQLLKVDLGHL